MEDVETVEGVHPPFRLPLLDGCHIFFMKCRGLSRSQNYEPNLR